MALHKRQSLLHPKLWCDLNRLPRAQPLEQQLIETRLCLFLLQFKFQLAHIAARHFFSFFAIILKVPSLLPRRIRDRELSTNSLGQNIRDLDMSWHGFRMTSLRILPDRMFFAFSANHTPITPKVSKQGFALHSTTTSCCCASGGNDCKDSCRRCSRINPIASRRLSRHSSRDRPCPFAPGTSAQ